MFSCFSCPKVMLMLMFHCMPTNTSNSHTFQAQTQVDEVLQKNLFKKYLHEEKDNGENFVDSEQEEDFYWEDDQDTTLT